MNDKLRPQLARWLDNYVATEAKWWHSFFSVKVHTFLHLEKLIAGDCRQLYATLGRFLQSLPWCQFWFVLVTIRKPIRKS